MPIYGYQCSSCQHQQDVLQKISDPVLTVCPACGQSTFSRQVSAPAFQLKGTGWYVTDFRDGNQSKPKGDQKDQKDEAKTAGAESNGSAESGKAAGESSGASSSDKAADTSAAAPKPASDSSAGTAS